jgi:hypothetical protein
MATAVAVGSQLTASADTALGVPLLGQQDPRWGGFPMNDWRAGQDVAQSGCAITSMAMLLSYYGIPTDPQTLNVWLAANGGYANAEDLVWSAIDNFSQGRVVFTGWTGADVPFIMSQLDAGLPVVAEVSLNGNQHFVVITGYSPAGFQINDPWFGDNVNFSDRYGDPSTGILSVRTFAPEFPMHAALGAVQLASTGSAGHRGQ